MLAEEMAFTRQDETELLTALQEGVHEEPLWSTFLSRLRGRLGAEEVRVLIASNATPAVPPLELAARRSPLADASPRRLADAYHDTPSLFQQLRPNRVYADEELRSSPPASTTLECLCECWRLIRVAGTEGASAWLYVARGPRAFSSSDGALLGALAPHLTIALRLFGVIIRERVKAAVAGRGLARFGVGWILLDPHGRVTDWSEEADRMLQVHLPVWQARDGQRRFPASVSDIVARALTDDWTGARAVRLSIDPSIDLVVVPLADPLATAIIGASAIGYVRGGKPVTTLDAVTIGALFGLPAAEARLAAHLAVGGSIAEAAERLGITVETARNYSKRVYAKTGARGQSDLVRAILGSGAVMA